MEHIREPKLHDFDGDLNKRWFIGIQYKHPGTGKHHTFKKWVSSKAKTRSERYKLAESIISQFKVKLRQGWRPFDENHNLSRQILKAVEYAFLSKQKYLRQRSVSTYKTTLKHFNKFINEQGKANMAIELFGKRDVYCFADYLKNKLSNRSVNNHIENMRTLFNELKKREELLVNPFSSFSKLQIPQTNITSYTKSEIIMINKYLNKSCPELLFISKLIYYCYLRPVEITRLEITDIIKNCQQIVIRSEVSKNKKNQRITIPKAFQADVQKFIEYGKNKKYLCSKGFVPGNTKIAPTRIAEAWKKQMEHLGIEKRIYDMKNTGIGYSIEAGLNVRDIQLQLRHESLETTQKYLERFNKYPGDSFVNNYPAFC